LHYTRYTSILESYGDSKWIFDVKDSKFTSEYVFILGGAVVSWKSSKKSYIGNIHDEIKIYYS
jgi:hypothetical protein